jgi:transcription elongation factor Elf1
MRLKIQYFLAEIKTFFTRCPHCQVYEARNQYTDIKHKELISYEVKCENCGCKIQSVQ